MYNGANIAGEADPRLERTEPDGTDFLAPNSSDHSSGTYVGTDAAFVDYLDHASRQRQAEEDLHAERGGKSHAVAPPISEKTSGIESKLTAEEQERMNARRALRSASWAAVFYLITTDILGPFNAPYAISTVGYVPGVLLYFFMGIIACYTGLLLWYLFLKLDSDVYPVKTYSDMGRRIFGTWFGHLCAVLQTIQLIVNVGTIVLSNGQSLSQISKGKLCFAVCIVIWAFVGMFVGQIRSLKSYGWLANSAVWINLSLIFISMGFIAHSPPNYEGAKNAYGDSVASGPVTTATFVGGPLYTKVNGIMNMVFAYGGAMIFPEMLAEMRRPWDFWKGMVSAQLLIFVCYLMYGIFVYSFQGQYTLGLAYTGVSKYAWQTVGNVLALITGIIAAGLYGNIGIKVAYYSIVEGIFHGPPLTSRQGRFIWSGMVIVYWSLAFVIGAAIPQVQTISGLVGAVCIMQFTYTFPPLLVWGYLHRRGRIPGTPPMTPTLHLFKWANFVLFLAALSLAALGMYGSGTQIAVTFQGSQATSFGCLPPV